MSGHPVVLVGGPDSGKTNFLARFWAALRARKGALIAPAAPGEIKYVEDALAHLLQGQFAPRSDKALEEGHSFAVPVIPADVPDGQRVEIVVPDVSGELWNRAVETCELPQQWMDDLKEASGALVFVRIGSAQNVAPLDWVRAAGLLSLPMIGGNEAADDEKPRIPTQVSLCELLRFLEHSLGTDHPEVRPRVAVLVTAWDRLDAVTAGGGPTAYLAREYPLVVGRLKDISRFDLRVFGVSVVGGDFIDDEFKERFFKGKLDSSGYVVQDVGGTMERKEDLTLPVAWVVNG